MTPPAPTPRPGDQLASTVCGTRVVVIREPADVPPQLACGGATYATDVDADDRPHLYRCRTLTEAGIPVAAGTDAPYGTPDPWAVMRAATERDDGERLPPEAALRLFTGEPRHPTRTRRLAVGAVADLCLLHEPLRAALDVLSGELVRAAYVSGRRMAPA
ncbi:amidohydrolase family protein [Streptomyces sp. NPDC050549]|uniref:amidohydrolase family protein n=1 Tax=Streptomyces sp. NPDC050549 TaxID=3155406 RepID=UPI00344ABDCF